MHQDKGFIATTKEAWEILLAEAPTPTTNPTRK
jgi:hypothetical protein